MLTTHDPTPQLTLTTLEGLPAAQRPRVDPRSLHPRIVHLGLGAFHRAHQAVYTEIAAAAADEPWGIVAVAPSSTAIVDAMRSQDCLYSVTDRIPDESQTTVVGSIVEALAMRPDQDRVCALLASPETTVVTLTITEKGYFRRPRGAALDVTAPAVASDLAATADDRPVRTVIGRLATGLADRYRTGAAPVTVVSCDNIAGNGPVLGTVVRDFVAASSWPDREDILTWMHTSVAFPATVVDRIVPATTQVERAAAAATLGLRDDLAVQGEPFRQWVLEDSFVAARPRWESGGALVVPDVAPYQQMKLRLLNGAHSALAYLGLATGCRTVADVLTTDWGEDLVRRLGAEVAPTLPDAGLDITTYVDDLVVRFSNSAMHHALRQIGSDGSQKIPERWLGSLRDLRAQGSATSTLEAALAGWVAATRPGDAGGQAFGTSDPAADRLAACWQHCGGTVSTVGALLRVLGADDLAESRDLTEAVSARVPGILAGRVEI